MDHGQPVRGRGVRRIWAQIQPMLGQNRFRLWVVAALSLLDGFAEAVVLVLVVRIAVALAADDVNAHMGLGPLPDITLTLHGMFVVAFAAVVVMAAASTVVAVLGARIAADALTSARKRLFAAFVHASWPVQSLEPEGRLQELMTTHVSRAANGVALIIGGVVAAFSLVALLVSAVIVDALAAGASAIGVVILYFILRPLNGASKRASQVHRDANLAYAGSMTEAVGLAREVQVFDVGDALIGKMADRAEAVGRLNLRTRILAAITTSTYQNLAMFMILIGMLTVYVVGVSEVSQLGAVVLLLVRSLSYSTRVQSTVQQAADLAPYLEQLAEHQERYANNRQSSGGRQLGRVDRIELRAVSFAYPSGPRVLHRLEASFARGEAIGIVGPSGSGKSTLVQLLLRLREADSGAYLVDGTPVADFDRESWYRHFVYVPQDHRLLLGTVAENITFHRPLLTAADVERAARSAHLHDEILGWPEGYDTVIGHGAQDISGGQKQRLALARALASRPSVLILDEPTSALDARSEQLVQQTLVELHGAVTLFVIAHRTSTLSICDRVLSLRNGQIEETIAAARHTAAP